MFVNIETNRMLLKCIDQSDRYFLFEEFQNGFINKYLFDAEPMKVIEEADALIAFYTMKEPRDQNRWVMIEKRGQERMGTCGFHLWDRKKNEVEIGFELMEKYNGNGYMTESITAIMAFAKAEMKVSTIKAIVYSENEKCKKLIEKLGFIKVDTEECMFREKMYLHDVYKKDLNTEESNPTNTST